MKTNNPKRFVIIVKTGELNVECFGIYRSFKRAEADAKAIIGGRVIDAYVLPVNPTAQLP